MSDWTSGYVADIGYTYGYYTELNPQRVALAFLNAGLAVPSIGTACELGFGQGVSTNIHAAATTVQWWGTDFNPSQAAFAQEMAAHGGGGAKVFDQAFDEFCGRADLPDFDYIGLHGIWSWISDDNRKVIVDFVRRKLKVGGVLYISYNTMPGWAAFAPLRDLLTSHSEVMGNPGQGILHRIDSALAFADKLMGANPAYARANPQVPERIKKIKEQNRNYLAHEYFNRDWLPMSFDRMAHWLEPAKLGFACSAHYIDHIDAVNLSPEQTALLAEIPDAQFRQTVRDFCVNQQFRKDYWVKGPRRVVGLEQAEALRAQRVILAQPREGVSLKVAGGLGEATMQEAIYAPVLDVLADHQPRSLAQVEQALAGKGVNFGQLMQAVVILVGNGVLYAAQDEPAVTKAKKNTDRLNAFLCNKSRSSADMNFLASPVTGGGIAVPRFNQLFLLARSQGRKTAADLAQVAWTILAAQNQRLLKDGKPIDKPEDNLAELTTQAQAFLDKQLPILKALGIA